MNEYLKMVTCALPPPSSTWQKSHHHALSLLRNLPSAMPRLEHVEATPGTVGFITIEAPLNSGTANALIDHICDTHPKFFKIDRIALGIPNNDFDNVKALVKVAMAMEYAIIVMDELSADCRYSLAYMLERDCMKKREGKHHVMIVHTTIVSAHRKPPSLGNGTPNELVIRFDDVSLMGVAIAADKLRRAGVTDDADIDALMKSKVATEFSLISSDRIEFIVGCARAIDKPIAEAIIHVLDCTTT